MCLGRLPKHHVAHIRQDEPPLLCRFYRVTPKNWTCRACLGAKPAEHPDHTFEEGCRYAHGEKEVYRRKSKELGQRAKAGPSRDPAIPAVGVADGNPVIDDNLV